MEPKHEQKSAEVVELFPGEKRERSWLESIYDSHAEYVAATVRSVLGQDPDVEDILQQTFVIAVEKEATLRKQSSVRYWLTGIAINLCRRRLRKLSLLRRLGIHSGVSDDVAHHDLSPEDAALARQLYEQLQTLPANTRIAWTLRYIAEKDYPSIAVVCGCSVSTVKRRVAQAQSQLERWAHG